ncbi:MAG: hypothetical protein VB934_19060, partial [Polyangiaceae bacterium]
MRIPVAALPARTQSERDRTRTAIGRRLMWWFAVGLSLCLASPSVAEEHLNTHVDSQFDDFFDDEWEQVPTGYPDTFEASNRRIFAF